MKSLYCLVLLSVLLVSCSSASSADTVATSVAQTIAAQQPTQPVSSPTVARNTQPARSPTWDIQAYKTESALTQAAQPTNTPRPTSTKGPTSTPKPTNTLTPVPTPVVLSGTGDSVVDSPWTEGPGLLQISYSGGSNFAIWNYDSNGEKIDLLVNTIGSYEGTVPLDFADDERTTRFEVTASGPWEIEILPLSMVRKESIPGTFTGNGDDVVALTNGDPDLMVVDASTADGNFAIWSYGTDSGRDLLVNEIAPYTGTVIVPKDTFCLVISAEGDWSIEIKTR
jgi:hypothetical protein